MSAFFVTMRKDTWSLGSKHKPFIGEGILLKKYILSYKESAPLLVVWRTTFLG